MLLTSPFDLESRGFSESSWLSVSSLSSDFMCADSVLDVDKLTESLLSFLLALFHKQSDQ